MHLILAAALTLTHVDVVDVVRGRVSRERAVRIRSDVNRTVDASGKYLIPGLWDAHTHVPDDAIGREAYLPLFLANGVTSIRVMEGSPELYRWRDAIRRGDMQGPRMVVASEILDRLDPDAARAAVRKAKGEGADFIKVYDSLSPESYAAIVDEARRQKLPVAGHVPASVGVGGVARAHQLTIEHMQGIAAAGENVFPLLRKTWECPTLVMRRSYAYLDDERLRSDARLRYIRKPTRARWLRMIGEGNAERKAIFAEEQKLAGAMWRAGVGILAGTDNGNPFVFPGFSIHEELGLLAGAGMTPAAVLQAATTNPARALRQRSKSDFVVLDANPLDDIGNTRRIHAVILRGHLLDRAALDALLRRAALAIEADLHQ